MIFAIALRRSGGKRRRGRIVQRRNEIDGLRPVRAAGLRQRIGQDAAVIHGDADELDAELRRCGLDAGEGEGFRQHDVAGPREMGEQVEQDRLRAGKDHEPVGMRMRHARAHPARGDLALMRAAAGRLVIQECGQARLRANGFEAGDDALVELRFERMRRHVHREVDRDRMRQVDRAARAGLRHERALADAGLHDAAAPRLGVGARHRGQVDAERFCKRALRRQLLAPHQPAGGDVGLHGLDDALVARPAQLRDCRGPIHAI